MEIHTTNEIVLNWLDGLSKIYAKYEQQQSSENLSMLLGYISSTAVVKKTLNTELLGNPEGFREKIEKMLEEESKYGDTERYNTLEDVLQLINN